MGDKGSDRSASEACLSCEAKARQKLVAGERSERLRVQLGWSASDVFNDTLSFYLLRRIVAVTILKQIFREVRIQLKLFGWDAGSDALFCNRATSSQSMIRLIRSSKLRVHSFDADHSHDSSHKTGLTSLTSSHNESFPHPSCPSHP